jgi:predicted alternative tryptophan synthase beta-subunit
MKNLGLFCLLLIVFGFESCKNKSETEDKKLENEVPIVSKQCYQAIYKNDTINLEVNTLKNDKIIGNMVMSFLNMPKKIGEIKGEFRGDTLFADYSFIQGKNLERIFKNPIAILKIGDTLVLGNGKIETYLGASYFTKDEPIDFEKVKFKFNSVECAIIN